MTRNKVRPKTETILLIIGALTFAVAYRRYKWLRRATPWVLQGFGHISPALALLTTPRGGVYEKQHQYQ